MSGPIISLIVSFAPRKVFRSIRCGRVVPRLPCFSDSGLVLRFCMSSGSIDVLDMYSLYMFSMLVAVVGSLRCGSCSMCCGFAALHIFIILFISCLRVPGEVCCSCIRYSKKLLGMGFSCALDISSCSAYFSSSFSAECGIQMFSGGVSSLERVMRYSQLSWCAGAVRAAFILVIRSCSFSGCCDHVL